MEILDYFTDAFKQYATVTGRTGRKPYWMFVLIYMIIYICLLYTSPSPRDRTRSRMPSSA